MTDRFRTRRGRNNGRRARAPEAAATSIATDAAGGGGGSPAQGGGREGAAAAGRGRDEGGRAACLPSVRKVYALCCLFRILNTCIIRSYFDPDEFWQTLEPAYCLAFRHEEAQAAAGLSKPPTAEEGGHAGNDDGPYTSCPGLTWEWRRRAPPLTSTNSSGFLSSPMYAAYVEPGLMGPVRSHLPILPTYLLYRVLRYLHLDTSGWVARGPMILNALLVAAPVDAAVWHAATVLYSTTAEPNLAYWCLLASLLSWFNGYSLVRTFSNSQETAMLAIALALVAPELLSGATGAGTTNAAAGHPSKASGSGSNFRACLAFYVGGLSTAVRFTSLAALVPMGVLLALRQSASQPTLWRRIAAFASYLLWPCAAVGLAGIATSIVVDRIMYGFWTVPLLGLIHFNVILDNATLYGSHPWHWYLTAGLPAVAGLLLLPLLGMLVGFHTRAPGTSRIGVRNLWCILISYLVILSFNRHKEFRFIHPVLPLVCLLTGPALRRWAVGNGAGGEPARWNQWSKPLVVTAAFGAVNLVPVLYLGLFHQSGPISVNRRILELARDAATPAATSSRQQQQQQQPARYRVYYWTGECHSTPLHSHLHHPRGGGGEPRQLLAFDTWSLDCSPTCRADPDPDACETRKFQNDPAQLVRGALCLPGETKSATSRTTDCRPVPDFVVTFSSYVNALDPIVRDELGMRIVARFPLHLRGAAVLSSPKRVGHSMSCWELGDGGMCNDSSDSNVSASANSSRNHRSRRRILGGAAGWAVDVESEDVVLYASSSLLAPAQHPRSPAAAASSSSSGTAVADDLDAEL